MTPPLTTLERRFHDVEHVADTIGISYPTGWDGNCHGIALAIVQSDLIPGPRRVARGFVPGITSQHSWVVVGEDCYARDACVIDPTLHLWVPGACEGIYVGGRDEHAHIPHGGHGDIWSYGRPPDPAGEVLEVDCSDLDGRRFLEMVGPLDRQGWSALLHAPVPGWPAAAITEAFLAQHPDLAFLVPIDRVGMLTDRNPGGAYLPREGVAA